MNAKPEILLAFVTFPDKDMANEAAFEVVGKNCAAGANIAGPVQSVFNWNDKLCRREEWILFAQTTRESFQEFVKIIKNIHSDTVPCIIALPITQAWEPFKAWILTNCQCDKQSPHS